MQSKTVPSDNDRLNTYPHGQGIFSPDNIRQCRETVLKLQYQLDKAVRDDDSNQIRFLVHQLSTKSMANRTLSIYQICQLNAGRYTSGVDNISTPRTAPERLRFMTELYGSIDITKKPESIRRVYIPKPNW